MGLTLGMGVGWNGAWVCRLSGRVLSCWGVRVVCWFGGFGGWCLLWAYWSYIGCLQIVVVFVLVWFVKVYVSGVGFCFGVVIEGVFWFECWGMGLVLYGCIGFRLPMFWLGFLWLGWGFYR